MKKPAVPDDEESRLEALRSLRILDTQSEERFDCLTRTAKRMFNVPIAVISLVDQDRVWFKSCDGLDGSEITRDLSLCGHAILGDEVFIVPNAAEDVRFADNPLVVDDPHFCFYAGCPIKAPGGSKIGTLCVIDQQPRSFGDEDVQALKDLTSMVEREVAALHMATLDSLTGIYNRRGFMTLAQFSLDLCARKGLAASLVFMDINDFKTINDTKGHDEGDRALATIGDVMKSTLRSSDVYGRLGGDEFAIFLVNESKEQADAIMGKLCRAVKHHTKNTNRGYEINFSYGIVELDPAEKMSIEKLLTEADSLMYREKKCPESMA